MILFPPEDLPYLYYIGRPKGLLKYEYPSKFIRDPTSIDKRAFVFGSSVNIDVPDYNKYPLYKKATPIRAVLRPGDTLYLPAFWHHEVQSIPTYSRDSDCSSMTDFNSNSNNSKESKKGQLLNIAVNFWFANITTSPIPL